jgi:hypothetical protein
MMELPHIIRICRKKAANALPVEHELQKYPVILARLWYY